MFSDLRKIGRFSLLTAAAALAGFTAPANATTLYSNDFNTFKGGFSNPPSSGRLDSNDWRLTGLASPDMNFGATGPAYNQNDYNRNNGLGGTPTGHVSGGGFYAYNVATNNNAFGFKQFLAPPPNDYLDELVPGTVTLRVANTTGSTLNALSIAYDILAYDDGGKASSVQLAWSNDDSTYHNLPLLDFATTQALTDNNPASWVSTPFSANITTGLSVAPGDFFYLKWTLADATVGPSGSNFDEVAFDNLTVETIAIPEPATLALLAVGSLALTRRRR